MGSLATTLYTGRIYPGLRPFDVEDALLFFGREEQTDELLRRLDDTRFLAVVGLSGNGKSSLERAGLLAALRRGHLTEAGPRWKVSVMRPGSDPLGALARVFNEALGERDDRIATLRSGRLGLLDTSRQGRNADENLLLVVDQFEEIFRFQDSYRPRAGEATEFVDLLVATSEEYEADYRVYVVITLRSDYLGDCARFRGLPEALNESQYLVPRMARERLREAIEGPAALGGVIINKEVREELLDKTGDDPDQLPLLQHLLMRMWEIREPANAGFTIGNDQYNAVGGWDDALNKHADAAWNALGDRRDLAKRILQRLTEKAQGRREVRRPATVRELADVGKVAADEVKQVVEHFRGPGCNFLTSPDHDLAENSVIDISHESLIRQWKQLNEWTTEEANWGEWYRRVEDRVGISGAYLVDPELESALQARDKGRWNEAWAERYQTEKDGVRLAYGNVIRFMEESRKRRNDELDRLRRTRVIVVTIAVVFAALFLFASYFWWSAGQARHRAEANAREAREKTEALNRLTTQLLLQNGWSNDQISRAASDPSLITQSILAGEELLSLSEPTSPIIIWYYEKAADEKKAMDALIQYWRFLGYRPNTLNAFNEQPTDVIWFHDDVPVADLKRISLSLIRSGIQLRKILQLPGGNKGVVVGYDIEFSDIPPWSVTEIMNRRDFSSPRNGLRQAYVAVPEPTFNEEKKTMEFLSEKHIEPKTTTSGRTRATKTIATPLVALDEAQELKGEMERAGIRCELRLP